MSNQQPHPNSDLPAGTIRREAMLAPVVREGEPDASVVMASVSSDAPARDFMLWNDAYQDVLLILDHSPGAIDDTFTRDGLPIRDGHYGDQIGLIRDITTDGHKLGGPIEWCAGERAANIAKDCAAKLRRSVSVEAFVDLASLEQTGEEDGVPILTARKWKPTGAAITSNAPADTTIGISRDHKPEASTQESNTMPAEAPPVVNPPVATPPPPVTAEPPVARDLRAETMEIYAIAEVNKVPVTLRDAALAAGDSPDQFKVRAFNAIQGAPEAAPITRQTAADMVDLDKKDIARYSIMNAIRSMIPGERGVDATFEREISDHIAKTTNRTAKGILIPAQLFLRRDLEAGGSGGNLVATDLRSDLFIDILANKSVVQRLGATMMSGLVGDIEIPKQTGASAAYWVAESTDVTESTPTLGQVAGNPHTVGATVDVSRKLLKQSSIAADQLVMNDIQRVLSLEVDRVAIEGTGASGQPKGLIYGDDVNSVTVTDGTPTYAEILSFITATQTDNADLGDMGWLMTPEVWAKMCTTAKGTGDGLLLDPTSDRMIGIPYQISNQCPDNSLTLGVWSQLVIGMWGALDLTVDPYALSKQGGVRVIGLQDVDVMVRNGQAFTYDGDVTS